MIRNKTKLQDKIIHFVNNIPTPSYILCHESLVYNLQLLAYVAQESGAKILVALKGYSFWREFNDIRKFLHGATCSGVYEARLAYEEIACYPTISNYNKKNNQIPYQLQNKKNRKEICVFSPAYKESQIQEILQYATHIIFNSFGQWEKYKPLIDKKNEELAKYYDTYCTNCDNSNDIPKIEIGLRINPLYSEVEPPIYNPCIPKSRLGIIPNEFHKTIETLAKKYGYVTPFDFFQKNFNGLHFHTHCEQDSAALERTLTHVIKHFDSYIQLSKWINFGGGHHITKEGYDYKLLIALVKNFRKHYNNIEVFLEPGEAVGWQTGDLIGEVVDIIYNNGNVAILDISASCHMPDCLEMPYRPECYKISKKIQHTTCIQNGTTSEWYIEHDLGEHKGAYQYRFGGPTCLAGDVIGDYSFNTPLQIGDKIAFCDMMHYTIVKNTTFNGIELPSLCVVKNNTINLLKQFDYMDFKERN